VTENTHPDKNIHNGQEFWHRRLPHLNIGDMLKLKQKSCHVYFPRTKDTINCELCQSGKITRNHFLASSSHAAARLELIHADLCGRIEETSFSGAKYLLLLKDDYSRKRFGYFLKAKSEVYKYMKSSILKAEL
jgi:hypothetical protein